MSDEDQIVDGLTPNGVNVFTSPKLGLALAIKPTLTAGDLENWLRDVRFADNAPSTLSRIQLLRGAAKAGLIIQSTDKIAALNVNELDGRRAQWYGDQLMKVYLSYITIDPN